MSNETLRNTVYRNMNTKETDELLEIWVGNRRYEWSDIAFDVIRQILEERGMALPPQDEAKTSPAIEIDPDDQPVAIADENNDNQPVFYNPQSLLFYANAASKAAWIILGINVVFTLWKYFSYLVAFKENPFTFLSILLTLTTHVLEFFLLQGVSLGLRVLMEFEFNSRGIK